MSHPLISHNADLQQLRNEGYEIRVLNNHLIIDSVPYVGPDQSLRFGSLVSVLDLSGNKTLRPSHHIAFFIGEHPCNKHGSPIESIRHSERNQNLGSNLVVNRSFSNKPSGGYRDYHHKMTRYIEIISAPAKSINPELDARTFKPVVDNEEGSVFNYNDTNSTRSHFAAINEKLKNHKIGIIGLGGTGSYILDFVSKTPVAEIHLFDGDIFCQHNAFRAPGAPPLKTLLEKPKKVDYFSLIYSNMHKGIVAHSVYLSEDNFSLLDDLDFIFVSVDKGGIKGQLFRYLDKKSKSFIDVGMGIQTTGDSLMGIIRTTTSTPALRGHVGKYVSLADTEEDVYSSNIQIAELNALNASLAVVKWKKLLHFYLNQENENNLTYTLSTDQLDGSDPNP
ncbi:MAG: ThiF family adenylyltransferase [Opitutales bacterium]|nr:ThiF family adenylyltransferase [Opitutales bacterium]